MAVSRRGPRSRTRFTVFLLVLTAITLLTLDFRGFGPLESARNATLSVFGPVGDAAGSVFRPVGDAWNGAFRYGDVEEDNRRLRDRIDQLEAQIATNKSSQQELDQLKAQLDIGFVGQIPTARARVTSGAIGNFEDTVEIDKGSSSGVIKGMPVVSGQGLIGSVVRVSDSRAVVKLVTNRDFRVGAKVNGKAGSLVRVSGTGDERKLSGKTDQKDSQAAVGDLLVTSGVEHSLFPADVPIGKVSAIRDNDIELQKDIDVDLLANLTDLEYVTVMLYQPKDG